MDFQHLIFKDDVSVTEIVLNRPERRNALSLDLMTELIAALPQMEPSPSRRWRRRPLRWC